MTIPISLAQRLKPLERKPAGQLLIHEIYRSIQGESTFAGLPCIFVRTAVCDSRCVWCDTPHAFTQGVRMTRAAVRERVLAFDCLLVEITGGEPLLQADVFSLMSELANARRTVLLETSGAHDVTHVDPRVHIVLDLKCPDSSESHRNRWSNLDALKPTDQVKFVIASRGDWDWAVATIREHRLDTRFQCLVSGVFAAVEPIELVGWLLESGLDRVRFQLQLHKYVWHPAMRGV